MQSSDLIQVLHHLTQDVSVLFVMTHLCSDHTWRETTRKSVRSLCVCVCVSVLVACAHLRAFAPATLDEEADEIEERRVSVLPVKLSPVVDHCLLTHHKQATMCVFT